MNSFLPMNELMLSSALDLYKSISNILIMFVTGVFVMRAVFLVIKISPVNEYALIIQDTVLFLCLMSVFPILVKTILGMTEAIALKINFLPDSGVQNSIQSFMDRMFMEFPILVLFGKIGDLIVVNLAQSIYAVLLSLFICVAPIFGFLSFMLGLSNNMKEYFGVFISLCLWPILWNILGKLSQNIGSQFVDAPLASVLYWVTVQILQFISPIFAYGLFKSMSTNLGVPKVINAGKRWL